MKRSSALFAACALCATVARATEEVPFITTPDEVTVTMLRMAAVTPRDFVIDLGSGDGRIVITAARRYGARGLGVEIVPDLVEKSRENAKRAGVADRALFREQDLFKTDLTAASVITMYLLPEVNLQLRPALLALRPGTRIVSHDWDMGDWKPDRTETIDVPDKPIGLEKKSRVHLWTVPAKVDGLWCGPKSKRGELAIRQSFQNAAARLGEVEFPLVIAATRLKSTEGKDRIALELADGRLRVIAAAGRLAPWNGARFSRAKGGACPA
ncbi:MAG: class I SAM-dependent methyltransferase [Betaproteobacteria bacterium]|nr:class I SAM-dependent methyltransferase [Betaproteobacteria bacterium]